MIGSVSRTARAAPRGRRRRRPDAVLAAGRRADRRRPERSRPAHHRDVRSAAGRRGPHHHGAADGYHVRAAESGPEVVSKVAGARSWRRRAVRQAAHLFGRAAGRRARESRADPDDEHAPRADAGGSEDQRDEDDRDAEGRVDLVAGVVADGHAGGVHRELRRRVAGVRGRRRDG